MGLVQKYLALRVLSSRKSVDSAAFKAKKLQANTEKNSGINLKFVLFINDINNVDKIFYKCSLFSNRSNTLYPV